MTPNSQLKALGSELNLSDSRNKMITSSDESLMSVATGTAGHSKDFYLSEGRCPGSGLAAVVVGEGDGFEELPNRVKARDGTPDASNGGMGEINEASANACKDEATVPPNDRESCVGVARISAGDDEAAAPRAGKEDGSDSEKEAAAAESLPLASDEVKEGAGRAAGPDAAGGSMSDRIQYARKRSADKHEAQLSITDSVMSTDSWGGEHGSLPPLLRPKCQTSQTMLDLATTSAALLEGEGESASNAENDNNISCSEHSPPQDNATEEQRRSSDGDINFVGSDDLLSCGSNQGGDEDEPSQYINFSKLLQPSSSEYYYSQANRSNRKLIEKARSKKVQRVQSLDESQHSRISVLSQRSNSASYRGPMPRLRNGSQIKSAMRKPAMRSYSCDSDVRPSADSYPRSVVSEGGNVKAGHTMKRCSFSSVDIREHERIAGDNPCVTSGVPLGLGWGFYQHDSIDIDDYEINKGPPREKIEMMVPAVIRKQMLREEFGVTLSEMNAAMKEVNISKRQRRHSGATEHLEGWTEVAQSAKRKFKRFLKGTSTAKEEEKMWENARNSTLKEYLKKNGDGSLGHNTESAEPGQKGASPKIVPQNSNECNSAPFLEISFQKGEVGGDAPDF